MTHPLTDEICKKIAACFPYSPHVDIEDCGHIHDMRAAADWQLEQVKAKVETKLSQWRTWSPELYEQSCDHIEEFFYYVMQELRPQEDN